MKISIWKIISLSLFMLMQFACKKNDTRVWPEIIYKFYKPALEYVKLTPGKYLIYKDSATGNLDSVVVTKSSVVMISYPAVSAGWYSSSAYQAESFTLTLTKYNGVLQEWYAGNAEANPMGPMSRSYDSSQLTLRDAAFTYSPYTNQSDPSYVSAINIEGVVYTDVITGGLDLTLVYDINSPFYSKTTFYWAKGVGIIKRRVTSTGGAVKTYTLLRHN